MQDIISDAQKKRFEISDEDPKKQGIAITEGWFQELMKHPYHSSKISTVIDLEKTCHWHIPDEGKGEASERIKVESIIHSLKKTPARRREIR